MSGLALNAYKVIQSPLDHISLIWISSLPTHQLDNYAATWQCTRGEAPGYPDKESEHAISPWALPLGHRSGSSSLFLDSSSLCHSIWAPHIQSCTGWFIALLFVVVLQSLFQARSYNSCLSCDSFKPTTYMVCGLALKHSVCASPCDGCSFWTYKQEVTG